MWSLRVAFTGSEVLCVIDQTCVWSVWLAFNQHGEMCFHGSVAGCWLAVKCPPADDWVGWLVHQIQFNKICFVWLDLHVCIIPSVMYLKKHNVFDFLSPMILFLPPSLRLNVPHLHSCLPHFILFIHPFHSVVAFHAFFSTIHNQLSRRHFAELVRSLLLRFYLKC